MENISLSIINLRANKETANATKQVYLNTRPSFQRGYECWDNKLQTRFIETIILGRATNPIWTVLNEDDESEEVLDGMHRLLTALNYFNNGFAIHKKYLLTLDKDKYDHKKFEDLTIDDKAKIRNYNFIFNKLDSSYKTDTNKLKDMYEILNRSSKTLNHYEFNKVLLGPFYDIVSRYKQSMMRFFSKSKDTRGKVDTEIIQMLVFTYDLPNTWSSLTALTDDWIDKNIGTTSEGITNYLTNHKEEIEAKLTLITKIIEELYKIDFFHTDSKLFQKFYLPYKFIISRMTGLVKNYSLFQRILPTVANTIKQTIIIPDVEAKLGCNNRNAVFQRKLIEQIDAIIKDETERKGTQRKFSKKTIEDKLKQQNNICTICNLPIKENDYEGDHILPWTAGGDTIPENLQVIHKRCHQLKN